MCDTYADHDWSERYIGQIARSGRPPLLKMERRCSVCKKAIAFTTPGHEPAAYAHTHVINATVEEMA